MKRMFHVTESELAIAQRQVSSSGDHLILVRQCVEEEDGKKPSVSNEAYVKSAERIFIGKVADWLKLKEDQVLETRQD